MRRLIIMRHAKAEREAETDHARPLSPKGRRDANAAGRLLAGRGEVPDLALISTSQRTRDTWTCVCAGFGAEPEAWFDRNLYAGGPATVVELLAAVDEAVQRVIVIGHNPSVTTVASALSDGAAADDLELALGDGLKTSALACFDVPVEWQDVNARTLRLTSVDVPRG
jgi:phosphohistidine phosphatase